MLTADSIRMLAHKDTDPYIRINPYNPEQLNPNSYDLTLARNIMTYGDKILDVKREPDLVINQIPPSGVVLEPGELYLGATVEYTESHGVVPMINGKSSLARLGLSVHQTGGFGDIGFCGHWTLEITVIKHIRVYAGMRIAQLCWFVPEGLITRKYNGKYQNSTSSTPVQSLASRDWGSKE